MRIVCLSAESADLCARLGAWEDVVGVTAFADQTGKAAKPVVGGFSTGDAERVRRLRPDLVLTFSDVQAALSAELIRQGCAVLATNQRSLAEIADTIVMVGGAIGRADRAACLAAEFRAGLERLRVEDGRKPRVYFEEWPEPMVSGIGWVGELIELCGGVDVFASRRAAAARERQVEAAEVVAAAPDLILASWCGKPVDVEAIRRRPGFAELPALKGNGVHPLPSEEILQPGLAVLKGARQIHALVANWRAQAALA